jgi:sodium/proline symporter
MSRESVVLITLVVYKIVLIAIGISTSHKNKNQADYLLAGRSMGPLVASLSASASSSSAWTLLGVSGAAYAWGLSAVWLFPSCVGGFLLNWFVIAPRLRRKSQQTGALTLTEFLTGEEGLEKRRAFAAIASFIILFSLLFYVASQFQGSAKTFQSTFGLSEQTSILVGSTIILFYTLLGGFWAVSITDSLQGLVMAATSLLLPIGGILAVGGFTGLWEGMSAVPGENYMDLFRGMSMPAGIGFVAGLFGIGIGYPGQPHVVNRFMALKDHQSVVHGRRIAISWAVIVYAGMLLLGFCGRVLYPDLADHEMVFLEVANQLFHPILAGVMVAGVLSATMSTADSQLLVAAASISNDLPHADKISPLLFSRIVVLGLSIGAVLVALLGSSEIFSKVLFAWTAMGAAFGPLLIIFLFVGPVPNRFAILSATLGFCLSVLAYSIPETKGTFWERVAPFLIALAIAYFSARKAAKDRHLEG